MALAAKWKGVLAGMVLVQAGSVFAETDFERFMALQDASYAQYRVALFQTNKGDGVAAEKAAQAFIAQWGEVNAQFAANPPDIFAGDPMWQSTLHSVAQLADQSLEHISRGALNDAHETLESVRDELGQLRQRNHVVLFSDHVNAYHEVMESLLAETSTAALTESTLGQVGEKLGVLAFLFHEMELNAPDSYRNKPQYAQLKKGMADSIEGLRAALSQSSPEAVKAAINNLKPAYAKFFVAFG